jgi:pyruvate/2-oxoglutarate dehydrogenase complex dihydrolipoamide dehydrogenase (E3) component
MRTVHYDSVIVGTGQAGKPLATTLAGAGHRTAIIEKGRVGGTCVVTGCTPSKTMLASARVAYLARRAGEYGVRTGPVSVDMAEVTSRKRDVVDEFSSSGREKLVDADDVTLFDGVARFVGERTLVVDPEDGAPAHRLVADRVFLNVGARPSVPPIEGLDGVGYLDSTTIMELSEVPERLSILGAGPVGVEFAQMFARFGSNVTLVEQAPRLLPDEDEDVSSELRTIFEGAGITVTTGVEVERVHGDDGEIVLVLSGGGGGGEVRADELLVAVGRTPNSDTLDLEAAGLSADEGGTIPVDEHCRTEAESVWALGEVTGAAPFTHVAYDDYRVVAADVLGDRPSRTRDRMLPYVVFTDPELARVGLSERQARERDVPYRLARLPMTSVARAVETDRTQGLLKCLVDPEDDRILGATLLADHGGEIMAVLEVAMMGDLPFTAIRDGVIAHPTRAEGLQKLFASFEGE